MDLINKTKGDFLAYVWANQGNTASVDKLLNCYDHHKEQQQKGFQDYILQQDFNWFGRLIPKGTLYIQTNADYWMPSINGARVTTMRLDFYTVRNNEGYFKPFMWA